MTSDIGRLPPQLSADAAEFFGQVSDTFSQIGEQVAQIFTDLTAIVCQQASDTSEVIADTSEAISGMLSETAASVSKIAVSVSRMTSDIFSDFARWAQENPAYAIGGLVGTVVAGFGIYLLVGMARAHYRNVTTETRLQTELDTAIRNQAAAQKNLDKARTNYLAAYGFRHMIQHHRVFFPNYVEEGIDVERRDAEIARLGNLNSVAEDPGEAQPSSIAHYRFLYDIAVEKRVGAGAEFASKSMNRRMFRPEPVFVW